MDQNVGSDYLSPCYIAYRCGVLAKTLFPQSSSKCMGVGGFVLDREGNEGLEGIEFIAHKSWAD